MLCVGGAGASPCLERVCMGRSRKPASGLSAVGDEKSLLPVNAEWLLAGTDALGCVASDGFATACRAIDA